MIGHSILVADDEAKVVDSLSQLLESAGYSVVGAASTGQEAVAMNETLQPSLVLLDMKMPGMDGLEAAKRMMASRPVPIVACTAYFQDDMVDEATEAGVYAYVVKPFRLADLLPALKVAITRFEEVEQAKAEVGDLKQALEARKWVEQAKGVVMRTRNLSEEQAHRFLQQESQRQATKLTDLAKAIVTADKTLSPKVGEKQNGMAN